LILFAGQASQLFNDTWAFDTVKETWRDLKPKGAVPDVRYGLGGGYDAARDRLVITHGFAKDGRHDDTWALDLKTEFAFTTYTTLSMS
jgi:hypothetical protein